MMDPQSSRLILGARMGEHSRPLRAPSTWCLTMVRILPSPTRNERPGGGSIAAHRKWRRLALAVACICQVCYVSSGQTPTSRPSTPTEGSHLCDQLAEVRHVPFDNEHVDDAIYNQIMSHKRAAVPCLVDQITNETRMHDPRSEPVESNFRVGDLAFFLLVDITNVPFEQMLPGDVRARLKDEGVYAYFGYVSVPGNRATLQRKWKAWLALHASEYSSGE